MNESQARKVRMVINVMQQLKPLSAQCTLNTAIMFLTIASKPGTTVGDVQRVIGSASNYTSRALGILYKKARGEEGLDLIESRPHHTDMRIKQLHLTPKGMRLWNQILAVVGD